MPKQGLTRRNGQLQACEPCRKGKIRCGHESPMCHRCNRLGLTCVYDPSPMTRSRIGTDGRIDSARLAQTCSQKSRTPVSLPNSPPGGLTPQSKNCTIQRSGCIFRRPATAYETTKFNSTFSENESSFGPEFFRLPDAGGGARRACHGTSHDDLSGRVNSLHPDKVQLGIEILRRFPTLQTYKSLLKALGPYEDLWLSPKMIRHCLVAFWSKYEAHMQGTRDLENLSIVSKDICINSSYPLHITEDFEWQNWFGGPDIRWEMIGILFTFFGVAFYSFPEWDPVFNLPEQHGRNRNTAAINMRDCADDCLRMLNETNTNDITVVLTKNIGRLESVLIGDDNDVLIGRCTSVMGRYLTVGLHRLPTPTKLTALSEYRNALSASLYYLDKSGCIFGALPPQLNRFYCTYKIPLDLSEDELFGGPEVLAAAVSKLDANGWSTTRAIHSHTLLRARCYLTPIWEEILEMTLGVNAQFTCEDVDKLSRKLDEIEKMYPAHLQYSNLHENPNRPEREIYMLSRLRLDILQCRFLFEKLKVSRGFANGQQQLVVALEIMDVVLSFWFNRDQLHIYHYACDWLIVCYGVPSAGVLCVELLKTIKPTHTGNKLPLQFSRSAVIRHLTMFVGFLDWTRPTDGNYELCHKLSRVVKRIVDSVIDAPSQLPQPNEAIIEKVTDEQVLGSRDDGYPLMSAFDLPMDELENLDDLAWLNTIDWTQGEWLDLNLPTAVH